MSGVLSTNDIGDLVNRFKPIPVAEMPTYTGGGNNFQHPVVDAKFREIPLPHGRSYKKQTTIEDANAGKFHYAWLDQSDLERYAGAYRIVTKDCEAAKAKGTDGIPEREFNQQGVIYKDGLLYTYCSWSHHEQISKESENNASACLAALMPQQKAAEKDSSGRSMGTVNFTKMESQLIEVEDKSKKKG